MTVHVDVWLRGSDVATTESIEGVVREPRLWTDADVIVMLERVLYPVHGVNRRRESHGSLALRGLSWIVNPYEDGGVVIAIEITMGAAIAGPFDIDKSELEGMISRVLERPVAPPSSSVH
jgi:hypothetical protein